MAATNMSLYVTQNELQLVHQFMKSHTDVFHLGAIGRVDEYPALEILARLIRQIRGRSLREIIDSHLAGDVLYDIRMLRVSHAATGPWLDALEDRISTSANDDSASYAFLISQVARLTAKFNDVRRTKDKGDATFDEISYNLSQAIWACTIFGHRRAKMNNVVFLPGDNLPYSHD
jgi:hypothetical protein